MNKLLISILVLLGSSNVYAGAVMMGVPEIDGGGLVIALGLLISLVALFREKFKR